MTIGGAITFKKIQTSTVGRKEKRDVIGSLNHVTHCESMNHVKTENKKIILLLKRRPLMINNNMHNIEI